MISKGILFHREYSCSTEQIPCNVGYHVHAQFLGGEYNNIPQIWRSCVHKDKLESNTSRV